MIAFEVYVFDDCCRGIESKHHLTSKASIISPSTSIFFPVSAEAPISLIILNFFHNFCEITQDEKKFPQNRTRIPVAGLGSVGLRSVGLGSVGLPQPLSGLKPRKKT